MEKGVRSVRLDSWRFLFLPTVLLVLNMIDVATTSYGLSIGLHEFNPLFSPSATVLFGKFLGCAMLFGSSYLQYKFYPNSRGYIAVVLCVLIFVYLLTTANNIISIVRVLGV